MSVFIGVRLLSEPSFHPPAGILPRVRLMPEFSFGGGKREEREREREREGEKEIQTERESKRERERVGWNKG